MKGKKRWGARCDYSFDVLHIDAVARGIHIHEDGLRPREGHCSRRSDECEGWHNHPIAGSDAVSSQRQLKRRQAARHTHCVPCSTKRGELIFEPSHLLAEDEVTSLHYFMHSCL